MKNRLVNRPKKHFYVGRYTILSERLEIWFICKFWSISLLLDPDPKLHSQ
jgi:hypothetical protein